MIVAVGTTHILLEESVVHEVGPAEFEERHSTSGCSAVAPAEPNMIKCVQIIYLINPNKNCRKIHATHIEIRKSK